MPGAVGSPSGEWAPPPKPGLIPLRPLTLGNILSATFQVMRRNPMPTFGFALLLTGVTTILSLAVVGVITFLVADRTARASAEDQEAILAGGIATGIIGFAVTIVLNVAATAIIEGVVSLEVGRGAIGERMRLRGLLRRMRGRVWAVIGWVVLLSVGGTIAIGIPIGLAFALGSLGDAGIGIGIAVGVIGTLAVIVAAAWISTKTSMVPAVLVTERLPLRAAIRRSWTLTNGYFWRTFGIVLLVGAIYNVAGQIITTPISFAFGIVSGLLGTTDPTTAIGAAAVLYVVLIIATVMVGAIGVVMVSATVALLYIDLRMRKEGLDLELIRFVEARAAGDASVQDPLLVTVAPGTPGAPSAVPPAQSGQSGQTGQPIPPASDSPWG